MRNQKGRDGIPTVKGSTNIQDYGILASEARFLFCIALNITMLGKWDVMLVVIS